MNLDLSTVATIGKNLTVKLQKLADDEERVLATLRITSAFLQRDEIDAVLGQETAWATKSLFDDTGAPRGHFTIHAPAIEAVVTGVIRGVNDTQELRLTQALLSGISVQLDRCSGLMSGTLSWAVAGDEVSDIEALLGKECMFVAHLEDGGQADLFKKAA